MDPTAPKFGAIRRVDVAAPLYPVDFDVSVRLPLQLGFCDKTQGRPFPSTTTGWPAKAGLASRTPAADSANNICFMSLSFLGKVTVPHADQFRNWLRQIDCRSNAVRQFAQGKKASTKGLFCRGSQGGAPGSLTALDDICLTVRCGSAAWRCSPRSSPCLVPCQSSGPLLAARDHHNRQRVGSRGIGRLVATSRQPEPSCRQGNTSERHQTAPARELLSAR